MERKTDLLRGILEAVADDDGEESPETVENGDDGDLDATVEPGLHLWR